MPPKGVKLLQDLEIKPSERLLAKKEKTKAKRKKAVYIASLRGQRLATKRIAKTKPIYQASNSNILYAIMGVPILNRLVKDGNLSINEMRLLVIVSSYNWFARRLAYLFGMSDYIAIKYGEMLVEKGYFQRIKSKSIKYMTTKKGEDAFMNICKEYSILHREMQNSFKKKSRVQPENKIVSGFRSNKKENIDDLFKP